MGLFESQNVTAFTLLTVLHHIFNVTSYVTILGYSALVMAAPSIFGCSPASQSRKLFPYIFREVESPSLKTVVRRSEYN